ncbi:hypothetical protein FD755_011624, partial [Muntiacus reevesi]
VFSIQCEAVQSLHTLNDQISHFIVTKSKALEEDQDPFLPTEKETLKSSMILMRHLLMDAQRSEWLVVSCVLLCIRFFTVDSLLLFLSWWCFMFYCLKSIVKPRSCNNKTLTGKVLFISHLSMLGAVLWHF